MVWPMIIAAGAAVAGGIISANTSRNNADAAQAAALYNSQSQLNAGRQTAQMQLALAGFNSSLVMKQAALNAHSQGLVAEYNASLLGSARDYNNSLLDAQAETEWENYELQAILLEDDFRRIQSMTIANQGASGTVIDDGSNMDVVVSNKTRHAMDQAILRSNADKIAANILNAQARNSWEAENQIQKTLWEAEVGAATMLQSARYSAAGLTAQGALNSNLTLINSRAGASSTLSSGNAQATQFNNTAGQQLIGGFLSAVSTGASMYATSSNASRYGSLLAEGS